VSRPSGTITFGGTFPYAAGPASPGTLTLGGRFHYLDARLANTIKLGGTYVIGKPAAEAFVYMGNYWSPKATYMWDGSKWLG
jgi:hypothetical protein